MGVLNVTPDSFSDGGDHDTPEAAVAYGGKLSADGADLVDVGGESTRPGAQRVSEEVELARVVPVVRELAAQGIPCSVDTTRAAVAAAAVEAGAVLVNDVSGGLADDAMLPTVADLGVAFVAMHWRAHSDRMQQHAVYDDVVTEVCAELQQRLDACEKAGVEQVVVDPGLGFAKDAEHNWALLRALPTLQALGRPVLLGASRKRFLGTLLDRPDPKDRDAATTAVTALAAAAGCWGVRVHDVRSSADAVRVVERMR